MERSSKHRGDVRLTEVRTVLLTGPCTDDPWLSVFKQSRSAAFIELVTDTGETGLGETYAGYFFPESVPLVVDYLRPILLHAEPFEPDTLDVRALVARMRTCFQFWGRVGLGAAVLAGIEAALWDLAGKLLQLPVHRLLAATAPAALPAYATGGPSPWPLDDLLRKVEFYRSLGFSAVKLSSGYLDSATRAELSFAADAEVSKLAALRASFGPDLGILLDGHMGHREGEARWDVSTARGVMDALAPYGLVFFEEPLPYDDLAGYAELCGGPVPIAGGEQLTSVAEFTGFTFDVAQPDAAWLGIDAFVRVAAQFPRVAPHAWSAGIGVMQNVHAAFACPNTLIVELPPAAGPLHTEVWTLEVRDGVVQRPDAPGLGVHLPQSVRDRYPFRPGAEEFSSVPGKLMRS
ncbi:mandelate racemase/muconate lactonizing enzyme family protein [Dactylosporangium sp. CS-033363]|uniref:mandelate racemase/muconate lactonizing enzyme family protein n=1 Tax=Dactylosporangium sp. CS-033363 TaxID=3239935 RepID=UPI003D91D9A1